LRKLVVANFKGGVGKTTLAVNLGVALSRRFGRRVLLVDTDPSANITAHLRVKPERTLYHLIMEEAPLDDVLLPVDGFEDFFLIPSSRATQAAEFQLSSQVGRERILEKRLRGLKGFDYVIFDTPPSVSVMAQNAFVCAGFTLIPVSMDPMSLLGASTTIGLLREIERGLDVGCAILGIVPTFVDSRLVITRVVMEAIENRFEGIRVLPGVRSDTGVRQATASQVPVVEYNPKSRAAADFVAVAGALEELTIW
jgi:chromosome partitioning protein